MSVINTDSNLKSLCADISSRDLSDVDIDEIADAIPLPLLFAAISRKRIEIVCGDEQLDASVYKMIAALPSRILAPAFLTTFNSRMEDIPPWSDVPRPIKLDRYGKLTVLTRIFLAWIKLPHFRLGQLIHACRIDAPLREGGMHYITDGDLVCDVEAFVERYTPPKE